MASNRSDYLEEQLQLRDEAIKKLLDAHKELDREKLAKALNGLAILVGYPPACGSCRPSASEQL